MSLKKPEMILFDYGDTLLCEPGFDFLQGWRALYKYLTRNKYNLSCEEINDFSRRIFDELYAARDMGVETHERQFQRMVWEYLGLEFSLSFEQAEEIQWDNISRGAVMPGADKMLDLVNEKGIRSGVISNISWSGAALKNRINRLLPRNRFEFVLASSEYGFRKPSRYLFDLALRRADLSPESVWFCGDNPVADIEGAAGAGIFPVWYDCDEGEGRRAKAGVAPPSCRHLHIKRWAELIDILEGWQ